MRTGTGRSGVQTPVEAKYFFPKVQTHSTAHPASYTKGTGDSAPEIQRLGRGLRTKPIWC